ncbi:MAG TPA: thioredoxin [Cytophagales bacterium]|nr:thioredoxin [Cytophagales bacterium]
MSNQSFQELIKNNVPTLVDFHAEWCGPCKMMKPELEKLKSQVGEKLKIIKIDIDKNPQVASSFRVQSVPTLILFKDGQVKWRQSGALTSSQIKQVIQQFIS